MFNLLRRLFSKLPRRQKTPPVLSIWYSGKLVDVAPVAAEGLCLLCRVGARGDVFRITERNAVDRKAYWAAWKSFGQEAVWEDDGSPFVPS